MTDQAKIARSLQRFRQAVEHHDAKCPNPAYGIGMTKANIDRLGFETGEELWSGVTIHEWPLPQAASFVVLCDLEREKPHEREATETLERAVAA